MGVGRDVFSCDKVVWKEHCDVCMDSLAGLIGFGRSSVPVEVLCKSRDDGAGPAKRRV